MRAALENNPNIGTGYTPEHARAALSWFAKTGAHEWELSVDEQCVLLGGVKQRTYHKWKKEAQNGASIELNHDMMERLSLLLGIHKALKIIAPNGAIDQAVKWFIRPNDNPLFGGLSMKDFAVQRATIDALYTVRRYLDRARG